MSGSPPRRPPSSRCLDGTDSVLSTCSTRSGRTRDGLSDATATDRLASVGPNELVDTGSTHPWRLLLEQLSAVMVLILIGAAALSLALGKYLEAGAIGAIVVLFALLGFFQEYRAERAIAALRRLTVPVVRVVRGGRTTEVASTHLVPGDIVQLEAGSVVPADLRLIEAANLRVEEAALTGESETGGQADRGHRSRATYRSATDGACCTRARR